MTAEHRRLECRCSITVFSLDFLTTALKIHQISQTRFISEWSHHTMKRFCNVFICIQQRTHSLASQGNRFETKWYSKQSKIPSLHFEWSKEKDDGSLGDSEQDLLRSTKSAREPGGKNGSDNQWGAGALTLISNLDVISRVWGGYENDRTYSASWDSAFLAPRHCDVWVILCGSHS